VTGNASFLAAITSDPEDDGVRLIYADWLEEHGQPERAEFIRVQCELEPLREDYDSERADVLRNRERELLEYFSPKWNQEHERVFGERAPNIAFTFRRGFRDQLPIPVQWFVSDGDRIRREYPTLRRLDLFRVAGWGERLAACRHLEGLRELEIACWIPSRDAETLIASPYLKHLRMLRLWLGSNDEDECICSCIDRCAELPGLQEVQVVWGNPQRFAGRRGRPVIRCIDPWTRVYSFAPGGNGWFDEFFPGRLPDGRQAFGKMPAVGSNRLPLLLFDREGNQLEEREVELPPHLVPKQTRFGTQQSRGRFSWPKFRVQAQRACEIWEQFVRDITEHLRVTLGHRPSMIRLKELHFAGDEELGLRTLDGHPEAPLGSLDDPNVSPEADPEFPMFGYGGLLYDLIHEKKFKVMNNSGNDWLVNGVTGHFEHSF
jgi:uncharacterized protein (TIGR02996 family)